ncbi:hypothetical protein E2E30_08990 [Sphingomonas sp. AAP5]|uniref:hypothetical protein n=1 Tax=Sphingomonas sp. AAP5 TaxID=1523415 RepID=UPI001056EE71|nr:hypothetical protein [Sphingomonas sp. AAP5]QBM75892.1 hypothetical protein E2E30_08990 [Sphingomonas sp. AAP5]
MHNLKDRMGRLEVKLLPDPMAKRQMQEDAALFRKKVTALADQMDQEDAALALDAQLGMSPAAHFAWAMRFAPEEANVAQIMASHGRPYEPRA